MKYTPDKWVIVKISNDGESIYKIMGGWSGGYTNGDSWRLNSGIKSVQEHASFFEIKGFSGSIYECSKESYGTNMVTQGELTYWKSPAVGLDITVLDEKEAINYLETLV